MLQEAKNIQNEAVDRLVNLLKTSKQKSLVFKAPTGSGKTYMIADLMDRVLAEDKDVVFLVSSLSKGNLAQQNHEKFESYGSRFTRINPYLINSEISGEEQLYIPTEYNVYSLPLSLYKKGGRLMQGSLTLFFQTLTNGHIANGLDKKIVLIKDECHIATNNLDDIPEDFISRVIDVSATPKLTRGQYPDVEISNEEAIQAKLIKTVQWGEDDAKLDDAIAKFESVKEEYRNQLGVNPCLIIQISNKDRADEELENEVFPALNKTDLKWMLIVNDPKKCNTNDSMKAKKLPVGKWKKYAKENTSTIDVIIFKLTISEGWDIPRACMLYQIRDSQSRQLDEQVMGRVRRNPRLTDYEKLSEEAQKLAITAWIWGLEPEGQAKIFAVKLQGVEVANELKVKTTRLKKLTDKTGFDIGKYLNEKQEKFATRKSIFDLWRHIESADNDVQKLVREHSTDFSKWWHAAENIESIAKENSQYENDYAHSMEVNPEEVSLPLASFYSNTDKSVNIRDWAWKRRDGATRFAFDSAAEEDWADILKDIASSGVVASVKVGDEESNRELIPKEDRRKNVLLWGKNYVGNSGVKFEYYMGALHSSYPDFILKDSKNRVHIFEVKSVNVASDMPAGFDASLYKAKVDELKKAYQQASILTDQVFYLPVQTSDVWQITKYEGGSEDTLTVDQFESFVKA